MHHKNRTHYLLHADITWKSNSGKDYFQGDKTHYLVGKVIIVSTTVWLQGPCKITIVNKFCKQNFGQRQLYCHLVHI